MKFEVGDHVRWVRAVSQPDWKGHSGRVVAVVASDKDLEPLTLYEVHFEFGRLTIYGTQLEPL